MYSISQFRPALYLVVLLGMAGFALASREPLVWVGGCGGVLANYWLVRSGRFRPLPRLAANLITLGALVFVVLRIAGAGSNTVLVIGQNLVVLQMVKLWEQRANRDYAQLLVLSLLLMVAATMNESNLGFAILLVVYLFLTLYCCLLFHLKVETDAAKSALSLPEEKVSPRQEQRLLARSMRRLTAVVSAASVVIAVVVFVFFPRRQGGPAPWPRIPFNSADALTGFSDQVDLNDVTRITQNTQVAAHVEVMLNGRKVDGAAPLLLRGLTLDRYDAASGRWNRTRGGGLTQSKPAFRDETITLNTAEPGVFDRWTQKISLRPTGTRTLFAMAGPLTLTSGRDLQIDFDSRDEVIQSSETLTQQMDYQVESTGRLDSGELDPPIDHEVDDRIRAIARRPEVSGTNAAGSIGEQLLAARPLGRHDAAGPLDAAAAAAIEIYLKGPTFSYTLDLTDARPRGEGEDPYVWFLSPQVHRGHCEYFAGAMVLMCQSLGIRARMVTGFRAGEYNNTPGAGYYIVRQSHAHAWVEALTSDGWKTYDPTSGRELNAGARSGGMWVSIKHFFDFVEHTYATAVVAYDNDNRDNLIQAVERKMTHPIYRRIGDGTLPWVTGRALMDWVTRSLAALLLSAAALALAGLLVWLLLKRLALRRRAARMGIENLAADEQLRLARQLRFYDDLTRLLARRQMVRAAHQTPMEFARSLLLLPADAYDAVHRLTAIFYRVRFGQSDLSPAQQRRLDRIIDRIDDALAAAPPAGA